MQSKPLQWERDSVSNVGDNRSAANADAEGIPQDCMNLASEAEELYVKTALIEMAADFAGLAEKLEREYKVRG
jgi:hypothetical protein